jgi:hypothetical protein
MASKSATMAIAFSSLLKYVKAILAPWAAYAFTMASPMPLDPPVTNAVFPLNNFILFCLL